MTEDIVISPRVLSELLDIIERSPPDTETAIRTVVSEIISRAHIFVNRFSKSYFLREEPIHEFTGVQFRNHTTSQLEGEIKYRLILNDRGFAIYTPAEIPLDDMYDIRQVIAESQLPEFYEDHAATTPETNSETDASGFETA